MTKQNEVWKHLSKFLSMMKTDDDAETPNMRVRNLMLKFIIYIPLTIAGIYSMAKLYSFIYPTPDEIKKDKSEHIKDLLKTKMEEEGADALNVFGSLWGYISGPLFYVFGIFSNIAIWLFNNPFRTLMVLVLVLYLTFSFYFTSLYKKHFTLKKWSGYTNTILITLGIVLVINVFTLFANITTQNGKTVAEVGKPSGLEKHEQRGNMARGNLNKYYEELTEAKNKVNNILQEINNKKREKRHTVLQIRGDLAWNKPLDTEQKAQVKSVEDDTQTFIMAKNKEMKEMQPKIAELNKKIAKEKALRGRADKESFFDKLKWMWTASMGYYKSILLVLATLSVPMLILFLMKYVPLLSSGVSIIVGLIAGGLLLYFISKEFEGTGDTDKDWINKHKNLFTAEGDTGLSKKKIQEEKKASEQKLYNMIKKVAEKSLEEKKANFKEDMATIKQQSDTLEEIIKDAPKGLGSSAQLDTAEIKKYEKTVGRLYKGRTDWKELVDRAKKLKIENQKRRKKLFAEERSMKGIQWKDKQVENFIKNKSSVINKWYDDQEATIYDKGADLTELETIEKEKRLYDSISVGDLMKIFKSKPGGQKGGATAFIDIPISTRGDNPMLTQDEINNIIDKKESLPDIDLISKLNEKILHRVNSTTEVYKGETKEQVTMQEEQNKEQSENIAKYISENWQRSLVTLDDGRSGKKYVIRYEEKKAKPTLLTRIFRLIMNLPWLLKDMICTLCEWCGLKNPKGLAIIFLIEVVIITLYFILPLVPRFLYTHSVTKHDDLLESQNSEAADKAMIAKDKELEGLVEGMSIDWQKVLSKGLYKPNMEAVLRKYLLERGYQSAHEAKSGFLNNLQKRIFKEPLSLEAAITYVQTNGPLIISLRNQIKMMSAARFDDDKTKKDKDNILKTKVLLDNPVYTDKKTTISQYKDIGNAVGSFNYNYAVSAWFFIHEQPPSNRKANTKFTSILNYSNKPNILFNVEKNTLRVTMDDSLDKQRIIYETEDFPLQKWNNVVINYTGGTLDIFINTKLVSSTSSIVPFMNYDAITVGSDKGVSGGVCNVTYFADPLSLSKIKLFYKSLKSRNPPIV